MINRSGEELGTMVYEVNVHLRPEIQQEYKVFLLKHMNELLNIDGFLTATLFELPSTQDVFSVHLTIHYKIESITQLQRYFDTDASRMREQAITLFGESMKVDRRILSYSMDLKGARWVRLRRNETIKTALLYLPVLLSAFPLVGVFAAILGLVVGILSRRKGVIFGSVLGIVYFVFTVFSLRGVFT